MTQEITTSERTAGTPAVAFQRFVRGHNQVTLYNADCLDVLPDIRVDAIISDPPYGMNWNTDYTRFSSGYGYKRQIKHKPVEGDASEFDPSPFLGFGFVVLFGANHFCRSLPPGTWLVWDKKQDGAHGTFLSDCELAWMKSGQGVYLYRQIWNGCQRQGGDDEKANHPTQKPINLMKWAMERAKVPEGATVCDPYMGSGTTGIACLRTNRNFVGIEKDPEHFKTACARLEAECNQGALL